MLMAFSDAAANSATDTVSNYINNIMQIRKLYMYIKKDIQCGSTSGWAAFADAALAAGLSTDICKASKLYYHTKLAKQAN